MERILPLSLPRRRPGLRAWLQAMRRIRHQRRALAALDAHLLRDIGVSEAEARREAQRPAWDVPRHWLR